MLTPDDLILLLAFCLLHVINLDFDWHWDMVVSTIQLRMREN